MFSPSVSSPLTKRPGSGAVGVELLDQHARALLELVRRAASTSRAACRSRRTVGRAGRSVADLVADDGADAAVVHRVVGAGSKSGGCSTAAGRTISFRAGV